MLAQEINDWLRVHSSTMLVSSSSEASTPSTSTPPSLSWNYTMKVWVSDCCFTPTQQFFSYIMARTSSFSRGDDEVRFLPEQHA
jgi:hypothetical protein